MQWLDQPAWGVDHGRSARGRCACPAIAAILKARLMEAAKSGLRAGARQIGYGRARVHRAGGRPHGATQGAAGVLALGSLGCVL